MFTVSVRSTKQIFKRQRPRNSNSTDLPLPPPARPFVPLALRAVNESLVHLIPSTPVRWIDFGAYVTSFAGTFLLSKDADADYASLGRAYNSDRSVARILDDQSRSTSKPETPDSPAEPDETGELNARNYELLFTDALKIEQDALYRECDDHALFQVPIILASGVTDPRPFMYR